MRLEEIDGDEVGLLAGLHGSQIVSQAQRLAAVHGRHFQRLARRKKERILEVYALLVDSSFHIKKNIAVVGGRSVRAEADGYASFYQFGHRAPPGVGVNPPGARVVRSMGTGIAHDADGALRDSSAMGKDRARSEQVELLVVGVFDRVAVHVGPESDIVPLHQVAYGLGLLTYPSLLLRIPHRIVLVTITYAR